MIGFTRQLARELGRFGITVNAIAPGAILSGRAVARFEEGSAEKKKRMLDPIPLGHMGKPEELASVVALLVSRDASFVTGAVIDVNGGKSMMWVIQPFKSGGYCERANAGRASTAMCGTHAG